MREKVVPIPFLGREVSAWLYRTTRWVSDHPYKSVGVVGLCVGAGIIYEAEVTHKNKMPSPNVKNHLEYDLRPEQPRWRKCLGLAPSDAQLAAEAERAVRESSESVDRELTAEEQAHLDARIVAAKRNMDEAKRMLMSEADPAKRDQLQQLIDKENAIMQAGNDTTLIVRSGQLLVRNPHWDLRNSERNWSILSRDQQQQKDHFWYRNDRSKDDDYARNTYSRP